jgi:hypothetical protein
VQNFSFSNDAPIARQNPADKYGKTDASHVDYGFNMPEWCANCHPGIHTNEHHTGRGFEHEVGNDEEIESDMRIKSNAIGVLEMVGDISEIKRVDDWLIMHVRTTTPVGWGTSGQQ